MRPIVFVIGDFDFFTEGKGGSGFEVVFRKSNPIRLYGGPDVTTVREFLATLEFDRESGAEWKKHLAARKPVRVIIEPLSARGSAIVDDTVTATVRESDEDSEQ